MNMIDPTSSFAINYLFLSDSGQYSQAELAVEPFDARTEQNDYEVCCCLPYLFLAIIFFPRFRGLSVTSLLMIELPSFSQMILFVCEMLSETGSPRLQFCVM
jgi:hypothetical protein